MIKHIVLFKLKEMESPEAKLKIMNDFKSALESLPAQIDIIRLLEVGFNCNPNETFDIVLTTEFDNMDDLKAYAIHPLHVAAGSIIAEAKEARACVDYQF